MRSLFALLVLSIGLRGQSLILSPISFGNTPGTPTDSPGAGTYGSTQSVTLSDASASTIYYTTSGTAPNCLGTSGTLYTGAISVASTTTIKAIGCNGITGGGVLSSTYTITGGGGITPDKTGVSTSCPSNCGGSLTISLNATAGTLVVLDLGLWCSTTSCASNANISNITSVADAQGDTWLSAGNCGSGTAVFNSAEYYVKSAIGGTGNITVTLSDSNISYLMLSWKSVTGANATAPSDQFACANGTGTAPTFTTSGNLASSNELIMTAMNGATDNSITVPTSYTLIGDPFTNHSVQDASLIGGTGGSTASAVWSQSSHAWNGFISTFKP